MHMDFRYYPAFVAQVVSETTARIWLKHPTSFGHPPYPLARTILVDLSMTPSKPGILWEKIEIDDHVNSVHHGYTSLGPVFPHVYGAAGVYLSLAYINEHQREIAIALGEDPEKCVPRKKVLEGEEYEKYARVIRDDRGRITRFHGFRIARDFEFALMDKRLLAIHHADSSHDSRPPRTLLVPRDREAPTCERAEDNDPNQIFLEQEYARIVGLDIPKRPSGSGDKLFSLNGDLPPHRPVPRGPLHMFGDSVSDEVARIRQCLKGNWTQLRDGGLLGAFAELPAAEQYTSLDLIGHSRSQDGVLKLGELPLTPALIERLFTDPVICHLEHRGIKQVRLLGCRTGCSPLARASARALHGLLEGTGIEVVATRADLFAVHYDGPNGFVRNELLVPEAILLDGGPGDAPASDDRAVVLPSEDPPSDDVMELSSIDKLPIANISATGPIGKAYFLWKDAGLKFEALKDLINYDDPVGDEPTAVADHEVIVVHKGVVRSFDLLLKPRPRVRIQFSNSWYSYDVRALPGESDVVPRVDTLLRLIGIYATG